MKEMLPQGETLKRAIRWVSRSLESRPELSIMRLVQEAVFLFDLSPKDSEFLTDFFRERKKGTEA